MTSMPSIEALDELLSEGVTRGIGQLTAGDDSFDGRTLRIRGRDTVHFGSCSYLGLELDPRLQDGAIDALRRYGTQFASSRDHVSVPLYRDLEELLGLILNGPAVCTSTMVHAHLSALPVVINYEDRILVDQAAHSLDLAARTLKTRHAPVVVRHSHVDAIEARLQAHPESRFWYLAEGVYGMYGDSAPIDALNDLLRRYPNLSLYLDDAQGMSWMGDRGSGSVVDRIVDRDRVVVATSLAKSFGSGGAAVTCADADVVRRIATCGCPMTFSGPIPPPTLGASIASARIHLTPEIQLLQAELKTRIEQRNLLLERYLIPVASPPETPICFVAIGRTEIAYDVLERLRDEGFHVNPAVFPAVSMKRAGLRFTVTKHSTRSDIESLVAAIARILSEELHRAGETMEEVRRVFRLPDHPVSQFDSTLATGANGSSHPTGAVASEGATA